MQLHPRVALQGSLPAAETLPSMSNGRGLTHTHHTCLAHYGYQCQQLCIYPRACICSSETCQLCSIVMKRKDLRSRFVAGSSASRLCTMYSPALQNRNQDCSKRDADSCDGEGEKKNVLPLE